MVDGPGLGWGPEDAEIAKDEFVGCRPLVPRRLTLDLWQYWQSTAPDTPLFDEPVQNVALILHARAHGASVPQSDERSLAGRLLRDHEDAFEPVAPAPLAWGPRANLNPAAQPAVESPVLDVWIFRDGVLPSGILIVGDGLPEIREQVLPGAFLASLSMGTLDSDLVNNGVVRIELPLTGRPGLRIPANLLGAHPGFLPDDIPDTARQALQRFVRDLRYLAESTGLVRLHEADVDAPARLHQSILARATRVGAQPVLWAPGSSAATTASAALLPYVEIPSGLALRLRLSGDLLTTPAYRRLERIYRRATIDRIKTDLRLRRDYHAREAERLDRDHQAYRNTPVERRRTTWGATVILSARYDHLADLSVHIDPREEDAEKYYLQNVPGLARKHRENATLMTEILNSIRVADERHDSPVRRLAAGRLLDAAVRGGDLLDSPGLSAAFRTWSAQVGPMLWLEWRHLLAESGIRPGDVFSRNMVVHTAQADGDRGRELLMVPYAVMHSQRSAVLFDQRRRVGVYHDVARTARRLDPPTETGQARAARAWTRLETLAAVPGATDQATGQATDTAVSTATDQTVGTAVEAAVLDALAAAPSESAKRILGLLTDASDSAATASWAAAALTPEAFEAALERAIDTTTRLRALRRAAVALMRWAPQTARAFLAMVGTENTSLGVRAALMEAALEYLAAGGDPEQPHELAAGIGAGGNERVTVALDRARGLKAEYTQGWLELLRTVDLGSAVGRLQHGLPSLEDLLCGDDVIAAWASRVGTESARLARAVEKAADSLGEDGEPLAVALAKLGAVLEESFMDEFAGTNRDAAHELMALLTGNDPTFGPDERD